VLNPRGLGYSLILAQQSLNVALMYAQLIWLCVIGMLLNAVLRTLGGSPAPAWRSA
jgi:ABC-type nitrate/sulfonate/bicarbonate transport system permease component